MDGEGCIRWNRTPTVEITNKHIGVLMLLSGRWGGTVREKDKGVFVWSVYGQRAIRFLRCVGKYSVIKFPQIFCLILAHKTKKVADRDRYIRQIRSLKSVYTN